MFELFLQVHLLSKPSTKGSLSFVPVNSRQPKYAGVRAPVKKRTTKKHSAGAADDQAFSTNASSKTGGLTGTKNSLP